MSAFLMIAASAVIVATNQPSATWHPMTPRERAELRAQRTREMRSALKCDEAKREAFRYEVRRRILNGAASEFQRVSEPSNAVVFVSVDYRSGDILVEYADGRRVIQRHEPKPKDAPARNVRPRKARNARNKEG